MSSTLQQLEQIEIQQILALDPKVSIAVVKKLYSDKMELMAKLKQERLLYESNAVRPGWFKRLITKTRIRL